MHPSHKAIGDNNYTFLVDHLVCLTPNCDLQKSVAKSGKILQAYEMTISSSITENQGELQEKVKIGIGVKIVGQVNFFK
jgi:hypothetical protein